MTLTALGLAEARDALARRQLSAVELTKSYIEAIEAARDLNAFVIETPDRALAMAEESDQRIAAGRARAMEGVPLAIKDLFCTEGVQTTAGSRILEGFVPPYESTVSANLWNAGAVLLGKTNLDEFAMGSANITSYFGPVINPWTDDNTRLTYTSSDGQQGHPLVPGGSSGGSASAVAARLCLGATGTDTGGSIRQPASFTGIVGMKPTYGRCSRFGTVAFASSLDQAGPMTRNVRDAAIMLQHMAGFDPKDSTSAPADLPDFEAALTGDIRGLKVGIPNEYRLDSTPQAIIDIWQKGVEWLRSAGAEIREISLPHTQYALPAYYIVAPAEASSNLARYDGMRYGLRVDGEDLIDTYERTRGEGFGDEVKRRVLIGTYVLSAGYYDAYYLKAQKIRTLIKQDFDQVFEDVDLVLTPTTPSAAFSIGERADPIQMYLNDIFTVPASLSGLPGISVPAGLDGGNLPLGLQLIGRPFDEETVLRAAGVLEEAAGFDAVPPYLAGGDRA
ncbi:MAG: Asp-tRNA(Asn)/Glu-tRNA(Gln) amidotransferase subunit GatA [Geminicoccaceae bacterium]